MSIKFAKLTNGTWGVRVYDEPGTREPGQTVTVTKSDGTQVEKVLFELVGRDGSAELWSTTAARSFGGGRRRPRVTPGAPAAAAPIDVTVEGRTMTVGVDLGEPAEPAEPAPVETDGGFARLMAMRIRGVASVRLGVGS